MFTREDCKFNFCSMCIKMERKKGYIYLKGYIHQHEMKLETNSKDCNCDNCHKKYLQKKIGITVNYVILLIVKLGSRLLFQKPYNFL